SCADQQEQRECNLANDQQVSSAVAARSSAATASSLLERQIQVALRRLQRRNQSEHNTSPKRHGNCNCEYHAVDTNVLRPEDTRGHHRHNRVESPKRKQYSNGAAQQSQENAFRQELPEQSEPARAKRCPNRDFLLPGCRTRQKKVGDVSTRNQQHKANS